MLKTESSKERIRMIEYHHKISATMIYDNLPIHNIFSKVDGNTIPGLIDFNGMQQILCKKYNFLAI